MARPIPPLFASGRTPHRPRLLVVWSAKGVVKATIPYPPTYSGEDSLDYVRALNREDALRAEHEERTRKTTGVLVSDGPYVATVFDLNPDATHALDPTGTLVPKPAPEDER